MVVWSSDTIGFTCNGRCCYSNEEGIGKEPLFTREGGSIPVVNVFQTILGAPTILLGFGLPGENAHSPDEHLNLKNFHRGILTTAYYLDELSK
jgi:acetylornithine deacetylase/succinyl-diaminopimelate desuccinylase-like protein